MFNRMKIFTIYLQPERQLVSQKPVFLKEGFNGAAFIVPLLWALYYRLWFIAILLIAWQGALMVTLKSGLITQPSMIALELGLHLLVAYSANDWLRKHLSKKGYIFSDVAIAENRLRAQQRYFDRCFAIAA